MSGDVRAGDMSTIERFAEAFFKRLLVLLPVASCGKLFASENVPHRAFAQWADLPAPGQFVAGVVYEESEAYHIYVKGVSYNVTYHASDGES